MKKGDMVTVYEDAIGCTKPEGKAKLVKKLPCLHHILQRWSVVFTDGKAECERTINIYKC